MVIFESVKLSPVIAARATMARLTNTGLNYLIRRFDVIADLSCAMFVSDSPGSSRIFFDTFISIRTYLECIKKF